MLKVALAHQVVAFSDHMDQDGTFKCPIPECDCAKRWKVCNGLLTHLCAHVSGKEVNSGNATDLAVKYLSLHVLQVSH